MQTIEERYAEFPQTTMNFARIRLTIEHPRLPQSFTTAMHIPDHMIDDFEAEAAAMKNFKLNSKNRVPPEILSLSAHELTIAERKARETRELLSHLVTRSLSDAFGKETFK